MNNIIIVGRITKDLELKNVGSKGTPMVQFNVAVNSEFKDEDGNKETDFFRCVAFNVTAENIAKYFKKGSPIGLVGSMNNRKYMGKDGEKKDNWTLNVRQFDFVGGSSKNNEQHTSSYDKRNDIEMKPIADTDLPF